MAERTGIRIAGRSQRIPHVGHAVTGYVPPNPPISKHPRQLSKSEARRFFDWFMEQIPIRTDQLLRLVTSHEGHSSWTLDFSVDSLDALGSWYAENVETRPRTETEIDAIYSSAPAWFRQVEVEEWELTDRTFSFAYDVGVYFGEVLRRSIDGVEWALKTNAPSSVDYHLPILRQSGSLDCCPLHLMTVYAYGIARGSRGPERLRQLYDVWHGLLSG
jgi:hypothetical protein